MKITITIETEEEKNELQKGTPYTINEMRAIFAKDRERIKENEERKKTENN